MSLRKRFQVTYEMKSFDFEYMNEVISLLAKDNVETSINTTVLIEIYLFCIVVVQKSVNIF